MLSDPLLVGAYSSTAPSFAAGTTANFRKIGTGRSVAIDGPFSADQPCLMSTRQRTRKYGTVAITPSDFTVKLEQHFNVAAVNGVPQADIPLIVEVRVLSYPQYHTANNLQALLNANFAIVTTNLSRLQSGEGV